MSITSSGLRAGVLGCILVAAFTAAVPALAQTSPPPRFEQVDANGVDLVTGRFVFGMTEGSIGSGDGAVSLHRGESNDYGRTDQWSGVLYQRTEGGTTLIYVQFGATSDTFTISGSTYTSTKANGATLVDAGGGYTYTSSDGTTVGLSTSGPEQGYLWIGPGCNLGIAGTCALPMSVTRPNGTSFTLNWDIIERCHQYDWELNCINSAAYYRFDGVTSSTGYSFSFNYLTDNPLNQGAPQTNWYKRTGATFTNTVTAPPSNPTVTYTAVTGAEEVTDTGGRTWRIAYGSGNITGIRRPGSGSDDITVSYSSGLVTSVTRDGVTTSYSRSVSGSTVTMTVTNALSQVTTVVSSLTNGRITSVTDGLSRTLSFQYDSNARMTRVTRPEGDYTQYTYDSRGNLTETRNVAKSGSGLSDIVTSATYPSSCSNPITCNRPTTTTDARNYTTDYSWDSTHGALVSVTRPAPSGSGDRPETRYSYTQTNGEYRLTGISTCSAGTSPNCVGTADEMRTVIGYDSQGHVNSLERRNGSNTISATTTATWDAYGNLTTVDGPLSGTADTTRYRYNAAQQVIGVIGPDPDDGGSLKHRAIRTTYRSDGLQTKVERGTVNSQSDSDWTNFASLEELQVDYDSNDRSTVSRLVSGSTTFALTQASYDGLGRIQCIAQRMNPSEFASLPSDACTLDTQGSYGADRITRRTYDSAGQVTLVQTGYGVSGVQADEAATAYTSNGRISHVTDAEGNRTTYEYDGHDRLVKTRFPLPSTDNSSSTTDYEQFTLDANGNVTSRRLRDGNSIGMTYDTLNRLTARDMPGSEPDPSYTYDLMNRMTGASQTGNALSFTFDALGHNLTQVGPRGTISYLYDLAGRRTRMTYADSGLYIDYDYLVTGELTKIRENGATSGAGVLGTYAYDDRGRRTSLTRGNGTTTSYSYDNVSRLSQLVQDPSGTSHDLTLDFTYDPASQLATNTRSNDTYAWTNHYAVNRNYTANGLNQYSAAGSVTPTYDSRGNLTSAGNTTYGYNSDNRLVSATGGITLSYDPLLRLYETSGGTTTRMAYDGERLVAEYNGSNTLLRRYAHGPGLNEPLVWYEGTGTSDRRWLHADERGSIVAISNGSGSVTSVNTYDEYGIPGSGNTGRFQYTGQQWIGELGMYHYRARFYSPTLGRFLQTDPVGFRGGMNLYAYVGNNPINFTDPLGLCSFTNWAHLVQKWNSEKGGYEPPVIAYYFVTQDSACDTPSQSSFVLATLTDLGSSDGNNDENDDEDRLPCDNQRAFRESGRVSFSATTISGAFILGGGFTSGTFRTESGIRGTFTAGEFTLGIEAQVSVIVGFSANLSTFSGGNDFIGASFLLDDISRYTDLDGNFVGASTSVVGRGLQFGIVGGFSNTTVTVTHCPGN
ncbi:MAG TPA: RHS repeat-associated core domain-containing protein [Allosphingosinicella sp.]|nr:RHS repeat-associated core domain-containing protein [Allosphingosinicella sp.]